MHAIPSLGDQPRILISRLSHIGDCVLTIPVANALRDRFPKAFIAWAIEPPGDRLIKRCESVDEVITVPKGWLKKPRQAWNLRRQLRTYAFDIAIDPQSLTKSSGVSYISGAKIRIGLEPPLGRELSGWLNTRLVGVSSDHVVDRSIEMLKALGVSNSEPRFDLDIPETAIAFANKTADEFHLQSGFVVLNPGAGWVSRQWENRRFGEVAAHIGKKHGLTVVVTWFGDNERLMAREIIQTSSGHAVMAPPSSIWDLAALIEKSHFYVGCDTGPTHLAAALGASCITLFGTTQPEVSGPYQKHFQSGSHIHLQKFYQSGSSRERRKAENVAMLAIDVNDVKIAVDRMVTNLGNRCGKKIA